MALEAVHRIDALFDIEREINGKPAAERLAAIFPNEAAIRRLVGAILLEQNDEWAVQRGRYMTLETIAGLCNEPIIKLPAVAA
jgi:transposase-like protein